MKKHYNKLLDEIYYEEELANGLKVIIFHKKDFHMTSCAFGTPYGAFDIKERAQGKEYNFHPGIAHFLEHKLFESDHGDVMNDFFSMGASVNAFTSYRETVYYFNMTGDNIDKPLNLLLDFVQNLDITHESVEKEKGIINQELKMYMTMPDTKLLNETFKALYHKYPIKYDIGGDEESVNAITKEELETCYYINYHPSNMYLVISTYLNPSYILDIIKKNQDSKDFVRKDIPEVIFDEEPSEVVSGDVDVKFNIFAPKHVYAIKLKPDFKDAKDALRKEWAMRILLETHFSTLNPEYQVWMDNKLINDYFGYEVDFDINVAYILFYVEGRTKAQLKELIDSSLKEKILNEDILTQIKRRFLGMAFNAFNDIDSFNLSYVRDILGGIDIFDTIEAIDSLSLDYIYEVYNSFNYDNYSLVSILPNNS